MTGGSRAWFCGGPVLLRSLAILGIATLAGAVLATTVFATTVLGAAAPSVSIKVFHGTAVVHPMGITGTVTTYTDARIRYPVGITAGPDGALWFTDYLGNSIGRVEIRPPTRK